MVLFAHIFIPIGLTFFLSKDEPTQYIGRYLAIITYMMNLYEVLKRSQLGAH